MGLLGVPKCRAASTASRRDNVEPVLTEDWESGGVKWEPFRGKLPGMRATPMRHPIVWPASPRRRIQSQVGIGNPASVVLHRNGRHSDRNPYSEPVRIGRFSPNLGLRFSLNLGLRFDRGCPPLDLHTGFLLGWPGRLCCHLRYSSTEALRRQYSYGGSKVVRRRTYGGATVKLWCYVSGCA